jgi:hypothetical protein
MWPEMCPTFLYAVDLLKKLLKSGSELRFIVQKSTRNTNIWFYLRQFQPKSSESNEGFWALTKGLEIAEVMRLASYFEYDTTLKYYPAVKDDLVDRARRAVGQRISREMLEEEV